ncbi:MAG: RNA polymerase sigma factor [Cyclobacteriaceae bacterium]
MDEQSRNDLLSSMRDDGFLKALYDKLLPVFDQHVRSNSGTTQEAKDLFQEALIVIYRRVKDPNFTLSASLETFVFSVGKKMWLYELRKRKNSIPIIEVIDDSDSNKIDQLLINEEKRKLYIKHFNLLSDGCQEILMAFFKGLKMSEIAAELGFGSEGYARKRKHQCQEKLVDGIKSDSLFTELRNEQ